MDDGYGEQWNFQPNKLRKFKPSNVLSAGFKLGFHIYCTRFSSELNSETRMKLLTGEFVNVYFTSCVFYEQRRKQIPNFPVQGMIVEQKGKYRIEWGKKKLFEVKSRKHLSE